MATTVDVGAELFREIGNLADDEGALRKMLKYAKKLVAKREAEPPVISKEEIISGLKGAMTQFELYKQGKAKFMSWEEFQDELRREGYYD